MGQTTFFREKAGVILDSDKLIGCKVENSQGKDLGKIERLLIDMSDSRVTTAVLSFGGFMGFGEKLFPIPLSALKYKADDECCILDVDQETLKNAPGYDPARLTEAGDRSWLSQVYSHYGARPYWE